MKDILVMRTDILHSSGIISEQVYSACMKTIDDLCAETDGLDEEKAGIFITHLAMALQRISKNEIESPVGDAVAEELKKNAAYDQALRFLGLISEHAEFEIPESEKQYLMIHLCNLFAKQGEEKL